MAVDALAAAVTALVAVILALTFGRQYARRGSLHALWWGIAFLATAGAAALQLAGFLRGAFDPGGYRVYVVLAAAVPALMGAGTLFLLWPRWAWPYTALTLAFVALTAVGAGTAPLAPGLLHAVLRASEEVTRVLPSSLVTTGFAVLGTLGALALVLGALWSWWRTRLGYNLLIAAGGVVFSVADSLAAYGVAALFYVAQIAGILLLYWGVEASRRRREQVGAVPRSTAS
ncbi:MAG: hypothetical protein K6V97_10135 [Actinomycetia bacterium]|nr:hypothetical protein [Actinomycetes bacterium]